MNGTDRDNITNLEIPADAAGQRLDRVLTGLLPDMSRSRLQALLSEGRIEMDGHTATDASRKVKGGEKVSVTVPPPVDSRIEAQDIPLDIVYEDEHLIVVNKPAGLVVHPAPGSPDKTLVNALLAHCGDSLLGIGGEKRPGIVHRIDKDTSGLMVAAKTEKAHAGLAAQFKAHTLERVYTAIVWGQLMPPEGTITGNIGRDPRNRKRMAVVTHGGKEAVTHYRTLAWYGARYGDPSAPAATLVECRLETGRTHQIRVHLSNAGHPLLGDPLYGQKTRHQRKLPAEILAPVQALSRQALHAGVLGFRHPVTDQTLKFQAEIPSDMKAVIRVLEKLQNRP
jgi:23S rRNA pseudouridine1911/1915/1917 synthase